MVQSCAVSVFRLKDNELQGLGLVLNVSDVSTCWQFGSTSCRELSNGWSWLIKLVYDVPSILSMKKGIGPHKQRAAGDIKWLKWCPAFDRLQFIATSITAFLPTLGIATSTVSKAGIKSKRGSTSRISSDVRRTKPSCTSSDVPRCSKMFQRFSVSRQKSLKKWKSDERGGDGWGSRSESLLIVHCSKTLQDCLLRVKMQNSMNWSLSNFCLGGAKNTFDQG